MKRVIVLICIASLALFSCKKDKKGKSGGKGQPALTNLNTFKIKSTGGKKKVLFDGEMRFGTVLITAKDMEKNVSVWMWPEGGDCGEILGKMTKAPKSRVMVNLGKFEAAVHQGKEPLPKNVKPGSAVILHKGFNRVLMGFGKAIGTATIRSGVLKPGTFVLGTIDLDDGYGTIKGNFRAKVCP